MCINLAFVILTLVVRAVCRSNEALVLPHRIFAASLAIRPIVLPLASTILVSLFMILILRYELNNSHFTPITFSGRQFNNSSISSAPSLEFLAYVAYKTFYILICM